MTSRIVITIAIPLFLLLFILFQLVFIKFNGENVAAPEIPREEITVGTGTDIRFAILGDSTAVGQGGDYQNSIAVKSADFLANRYKVTYQNYAVSGAKTSDVLKNQLYKALDFNPDIILISITANDVTHLSSQNKVVKNLNIIVNKLKEKNNNVVVFITGSPQMGSVPRFPQPIRYLAKLRTESLNKKIKSGVKNVHFIPIAEKTGPTFDKNPKLFAKDKFHPNNNGYEVWNKVIINTLGENL